MSRRNRLSCSLLLTSSVTSMCCTIYVDSACAESTCGVGSSLAIQTLGVLSEPGILSLTFLAGASGGSGAFEPSMLSRLLAFFVYGCENGHESLRKTTSRTFLVARPSLSSWSLKHFISSRSLPVLLRSESRSVASQSGALWSVASRPSFRKCNCARRFSMCLSRSWNKCQNKARL